MKELGDNLLTVLVLFVLAVVGYAVIVGGLVCLLQDNYSFHAYLDDLTGLHTVLIAAIAGALGRSLLPLLARRNGG